MTAAADAVVSVVLAVDRQTVMLRAFWTLVVAAGLVSIGAWILLVREVRSQRRGRAATSEDAPTGEGVDDPAGAGDDHAVSPGEDGGNAPAVRADAPVDTAEVGDRGDRP